MPGPAAFRKFHAARGSERRQWALSALEAGGWRLAPVAQGWLAPGRAPGPLAQEHMPLLRLLCAAFSVCLRPALPSVRTLVMGHRAQPRGLSVTWQSAKTLFLAMPQPQVRS